MEIINMTRTFAVCTHDWTGFPGNSTSVNLFQLHQIFDKVSLNYSSFCHVRVAFLFQKETLIRMQISFSKHCEGNESSLVSHHILLKHLNSHLVDSIVHWNEQQFDESVTRIYILGVVKRNNSLFQKCFSIISF